MVQILLLSPGNSVVVCVTVTIFTAVLSNCTHITAKYPQKTYFALKYVQKKVQYITKVLFYGAYGVYVVRVASVLNSGIYGGTNN